MTAMTARQAPAPQTERKTITILGSTGSIGRSTLDLLESAPEKFRVEALVAGRNVELLAEQAIRHDASTAVIGDESLYSDLKKELQDTGITALCGDNGIARAASMPASLVMSAIVGAAGLRPTLAAIHAGNEIALANKECLVCAGSLLTEEAARHGASLLPVDSEHNAIFQVFDDEKREGIEKLILTASGGPFRDRTRDDLRDVTPEQAVAHPNWSMGAKISVDSATMMNKALEVIEASYLFDMPEDRIDVVIHPQSIVHSMVEYIDGSILAQMGAPDMRTPIAYALAWPERMPTSGNKLSFNNALSLDFKVPDPARFPALRLVREVLKSGGAAPTLFNGANEIAVQSFLDGRIPFLTIEKVVEETLQRHGGGGIATIDDVFELDAEARRIALAFIEELV